MEQESHSASTKSVALVPHKRSDRYVRVVVVCLGIFAILVGAADVTSRLAARYMGDEALQSAFAPAAAQGLGQ